MNKAELINSISQEADISKQAAEHSLNATIESINEALKAGDDVQLVGFGTFKVIDRAARDGRNPRTGETVKIPAKKAPKFSAGKALKDAVN